MIPEVVAYLAGLLAIGREIPAVADPLPVSLLAIVVAFFVAQSDNPLVSAAAGYGCMVFLLGIVWRLSRERH